MTEQASADPSVFDDVQYVSLTTFRKTGVGVPTAVWIARDGDQLVVTTVDKTGKVKRLHNNPAVELRPCDMRGNVADGAPTYSGTAQVVRDTAGIAAVKQAIARKYPLARVGDAANKVTFGLLQRSPRAGIRINLT
ncbi:PPOX class F420-dependent oxidoreductase [Humibacillus sp. DSM 29435]|uniref:PPOX class F420-dependent oxidoreductase n=1 Tax=Humibacillus sp. DSM 29435 TaxID=1869167 RepID=UPI0009F50DBC|nr:PPOX class F420-dependent oxidoreductase [Humibacillus sp. DSM 29435]